MERLKKRHVTVEEAALEIGITKGHVYTLIKNGRITAVDISVSGNGGPNSIRIQTDSIESFLKARVVNPDKYFE